MEDFDLFSWVIILVSIGMWVALGIGMVKKKTSGKVLSKFKQKWSIIYIGLSLVMLVISVQNFWAMENYSFAMNVVDWILFPTAIFTYLYLWLTQIEFRENALVSHLYVTKYSDIKRYVWIASGKLLIERKVGLINELVFQVSIADQIGITKILQDKCPGRGMEG